MRIVPILAALLALAARGGEGPAPQAAPRFAWPCASYAHGLESGKGNFGVLVTARGSPFHGTWHLAEDVWLPAGTEVRAIADGVVRYSAFSPTWTDDRGRVHWNLGNVVVIEHELAPPVEEQSAVCSFHVHLAADRRVAVGDVVKRGQLIGRIGKDRSEENGRYPAHLHFGIHRGPYHQISPSFERSIRTQARSREGLVMGATVLRGDVALRRNGPTSVLITATSSGKDVLLSLLVGSTAPVDPPPDIMNWCEGYGEKATLEDWIQPSTFLARNASTPTGGARK